jgi:hypothetical protein
MGLASKSTCVAVLAICFSFESAECPFGTLIDSGQKVNRRNHCSAVIKMVRPTRIHM